MKAYQKFTELYLRHVAMTLALVWNPDKQLIYVQPDQIYSLIEDMVLLKKELDGEPTDAAAIQACWSRAHDRGFI